MFQLKLFSQQIQHFDLQFKNQFFVIDWTFLFAVIATVCTYLVIAFQTEK